MKKIYEKPMLICEDLRPEDMLCGCDVRNPQFSDLEMCAYSITIPGTDYSTNLFGANWDNCSMPNDFLEGTEWHYCFGSHVTTIFSS